MTVLTHFIAWSLGLAAPETQTTASERECLARHASGRRRLVEIGVWHGVTTKVLCEAMNRDGTLTAIDPFPVGRLGFSAQQRIAHREVSTVGSGRVIWRRTTGAEAANNHGAVDFVFIDGDHSEEGLRADWLAWGPLIEPGGIVALHDSRSTPTRPIDDAGSVRVTADLIVPDPRFVVIEEIESLTVLKRK